MKNLTTSITNKYYTSNPWNHISHTPLALQQYNNFNGISNTIEVPIPRRSLDLGSNNTINRFMNNYSNSNTNNKFNTRKGFMPCIDRSNDYFSYKKNFEVNNNGGLNIKFEDGKNGLIPNNKKKEFNCIFDDAGFTSMNFQARLKQNIFRE